MKKLFLIIYLVVFNLLIVSCAEQDIPGSITGGDNFNNNGSNSNNGSNGSNGGNGSNGDTPEPPEAIGPETPINPDEGGDNTDTPSEPETPVNPDEGGDNTGNPSEPETPESPASSYSDVYPYPVMKGDRASANVLNYLDYQDENNTLRGKSLKWGIGGNEEMRGEIQFIQTHNVGPVWNWADKTQNSWGQRPDVVPFRDTLLAYIPENNNFQSVAVIPMKDGIELDRIEMNPPHLIPYADHTGTGKQVVFSEKAWTCMVGADYIDPEVSFKFEGIRDGVTVSTMLTNKWEANGTTGWNIEYSTPIEVTLFFIQLGMLTPYREDGNYPMLTDAVNATSEYFQTVPFSKIVNAAYEPRTLNVVMLQNGTIFDTSGVRGAVRDPSSGDVYGGDMRWSIAKTTVSAGINLANRGVPSSSVGQQANQIHSKDPFFMTIHHARGLYANGVQNHGLSGGDGIGTLEGSGGNEFSHEVGHAYGLGHFTSEANKTDGYGVHNRFTGWGYDAYKNRMRANVDWSYGKTNGKMNNIYPYNHDSMNGGAANGSISRYTHNTARSTRDVQLKNASRYMIGKNEDGTYGYYSWDSNAKTYVKASFPEKGHFDIQKRRNPTRVGVPVITILAAYDPNDKSENAAKKAIIYPYFRANYGHVYDELFVNTQPESGYYLKIEYYDGSVKYVELNNTRHNASLVNKAHVNIAEEDKPKKVTLYTNHQSTAVYNSQSIINETEIPEDLKPMDKAVIIGRDKDNKYDYNQVIEYDVNILNSQLADKDVNTYIMTDKQKEKAVSLNHRAALNKLNDNARSIVEKYFADIKKINELDNFINDNYNNLQSKDTATLEQLKLLLGDYNVGNMGAANWGRFKHKNPNSGECLEINGLNVNTAIVQYNTCNEELIDRQLFYMDSKNRIHSKVFPNYCLTANNIGKLAQCSDDTAQQWEIITGTGSMTDHIQYKNKKVSQCLNKNLNNWKPTMAACQTDHSDNWGYAFGPNLTFGMINQSNIDKIDIGDLPSWLRQELELYFMDNINSEN